MNQPQQTNFRGFDPQQLAALLQTQSPTEPQQQAAAPQHNWRYANRNASQMDQKYKQFSGYQTDWQQNRYAPAGNRATRDELEAMVSSKEAERANQLAMFEQTWQKQQAGGTSHDHMIREGVWARGPQSATENFPWPIHAQPWNGVDEFLSNLELVESFLSNQKIFFKSELICLVDGCGCKLQNAEFVDITNKVAWPVSFIHYLGDHNNPPSRFFFDYIKRAAGAIRQMPKQ